MKVEACPNKIVIKDFYSARNSVYSWDLFLELRLYSVFD